MRKGRDMETTNHFIMLKGHVARTIAFLVILTTNMPFIYGQETYHGAVQGNFAVSPTGAATYTVPIDVPPGAGGVQPQIAITYDSQSGMGLAGWGCNLAGYSAITRRPKDKFHDGVARGMRYGEDDAYYLDGKRLVLSSGTEGMPGCIYNPEGDPYTTVKVMGTYTVASDNRSFEVRTPDGLITTYGNTPGTRQDFEINDTSRIAAWYVHTIKDTLNNVVEWYYSKDSYYVYPVQVIYGSCSIEFSYETIGSAARPFKLMSVTGIMNKRLTEITCKYSSTTERRYILTYDTTSDGTEVKIPRLTQIEVKDGANESLKPLELQWIFLPSWQENVTQISLPTEQPRPHVYNINGKKYVSGDLNADGISDVIEITNVTESVGINSFTQKSHYNILFSSWDNADNVRYLESDTVRRVLEPEGYSYYVGSNTAPIIIDFDGDGINDLVVTHAKTTFGNCQGYVRVFYGNTLKHGHSWNIRQKNINFISTTETPLTVGADFNNDGIDDMLIIEDDGSYGQFASYLLNGSDSIEHVSPVNYSLNLPNNPKKAYALDMDADGLLDLLVLYADGYKLFWNNGGDNSFPFSNDNGKYVMGNDAYDARCVGIGDFNGDGIPDLLLTKTTNNSSYYFAFGKGDGTFQNQIAITLNYVLNGLYLSHDDISMHVLDFDKDGKSDVFVARAIKTYFGSYYNTVFSWLRSTGTSLVEEANTTAHDVNGHFSYRIVSGDFDGTGIPSILNYGRNMYTQSGDTAMAYRIYRSPITVSAGKVTEFKDGLKNRIEVRYGSLLNPSYYEKGTGASFPVKDVASPIHAVIQARDTTSTGGYYAPYVTNTYRYEGLKVQVAGAGLLGFSSFSIYNDATGSTTTTVTGGWNANNRYTPTFTNKTVTLSDNSVSTIHSVTGFHPVFNGLNYYLSKDTVIITDFDGNTETTEYHYDLDKGVVTKQKTYPDGNSTLMYKETESADFVKKAGQWLPRMIYTRQKHKDDPIAFESIEKRTYNSFGLPDTIAVNYGTSLALTKAYTYDQNGNVLSETISGNGLNTITTHYEYDDLTHRFVKGKYTTPSSYVLEYTHDNWGNILTETDKTNSSNPLTTTNTYDGFGNLTESVSPEGIVTNVTRTWQEGPKLYCVKEETEGKPWVCTYYDGKGRETKMETRQFNGIDFEKNYLYDERGNLAFKETKNWGSPAISEWLEYDSRGRVTKDSLYTGSTTTYTYGNRQITETKDGRSTQTRYDAWGNIKKVQDPIGYVTYAYSSNGKPSAASTGNGIVTMGYDDCGNQVCLVDPDAGTMTYTYNAAGQIISQTDARGISTTYKFDALNRTDTMTIGNTMVKYSYGTAGNASQRLTGLSTSTHGISYTYDSYGHIATETRNYGSTQYTFSHTYDYLGRLSRTVYPGNVTVDYHYDDLGYNDMMTVNGNRVWYISDYDYYANGNDLYVIDSLGTGQNGLARTTRYDDYGNLSTIIMTRQNSTLHAMTFYHDRFTGNLTSRSGMLPNDGEVFTYDPLDRLVRYQDDGSHWDNIYQYTHDGNIQYKTGIGYYDYQPTSAIRPHAVKRVENLNGKVPTGRSFVTYNDLGKASSLYDDSSPSSLQYDITYGPDGERWESSLYRSNYQWPDTVRRYVGDMEIVSSGPSEVCRFYYLGHGVVLRKVNDTVTPLYAFTDNLGSITRLYTANGTEKFKAQYDPWGVQKVIKNDINFARGYCGHEMLNWFQLINMNGRLYDPMLGRFLSPDNYVQMPTSAQSFNRYSYCLNNPLKYVDPDGEFWNLVIGAALGGIINWSIHGFQFDANGLGYLVTGAFAGAIGAGIGSGVNVAMAGGNFWTGFVGLSNGISSTGFLAGAATGVSAGFVGGFVSGTGNSWIEGDSFGGGLLEGLKSGGIDAIMGGIIGGIAGGFDALDKGTNYWTGKAKIDISGAYSCSICTSSDFILNEQTVTGKYVGEFEGVNVFETRNLGSLIDPHAIHYSAVTVPERGIIAAEGVFTSGIRDGQAMMQHEFGHILQYRKFGSAAYWHVIAPESLASATFFPSSHYKFWTETWANFLSKGYFGNAWIGGTYYPIKNISSFNRFRIQVAQIQGLVMTKPRGCF